MARFMLCKKLLPASLLPISAAMIKDGLLTGNLAIAAAAMA